MLPFTDYKALVCVFLHGGNDSFNMLMPYEDGISNPAFTDEYAAYQAARTSLTLPRVANPITDAISGRRFGIHESMPEVKNLFDTNKLAFLANVGSLVQPTSLAQYNNDENLPSGLFSHSDQQLHWQTGRPDLRSEPTGWSGRLLRETDLLDSSSVGNVYRNIALKHSNRMQIAGTIIPYVVGTGGAIRLSAHGSGGEESIAFTEIVDSLLRNSTYSNALEKTYAEIHTSAIDGAVQFNNATSDEVVTGFPASTSVGDLGAQLEMVAKTISARTELGDPDRQVFLVELGGWDMHDGLLTNHGPKLEVVSQALGAFSTAMETLGVQDSVTTFTISDFGRTLTSNGNGSDHGWSGNHIVMGGAVDGGKIFGDYPTNLDNPMVNGESIDVGRGRLIPTTAVDAYYADLAMWFGLPYDHLAAVLPNLVKFYTPGPTEPPPVGFFK